MLIQIDILTNNLPFSLPQYLTYEKRGTGVNDSKKKKGASRVLFQDYTKYCMIITNVLMDLLYDFQHCYVSVDMGGDVKCYGSNLSHD